MDNSGFGKRKTATWPKERRSSPRTLIDRYYSVQFSFSKKTPTYQFKLRDISENGLCILVKEDSTVLDHVKVGEIIEMKFAPSESPARLKMLRTQIRHITKSNEGRYRGHFLVGLLILESDPGGFPIER
ncbi:MAG: hypothetical protein A2V65_12460 [Deltaproteobacteria bacterium RBG_13_49_15]|nr:MAG: hypothetical protein A2V65_12460 [Deltaproteobacteria bacterium RBG_13_49_15]